MKRIMVITALFLGISMALVPAANAQQSAGTIAKDCEGVYFTGTVAEGERVRLEVRLHDTADWQSTVLQDNYIVIDTPGPFDVTVPWVANPGGRLNRTAISASTDDGSTWTTLVVNEDFLECPECLLSVEKFCSEPPTAALECTDKIVATTLRYIGPDILGASVEINPDKSPAVVYGPMDLISGVTVLTMSAENDFTIDARPDENELGSKTKIRINGVEEVIHTSCSTPYIAGLPAPLDNPKGNPSPNWFVENFEDKDGNFSAVTDPVLKEECEVEGVKPGSCADGKPTALVFEYTGEGCVDGNNQPADKWSCSGDPNFAAPVEVVMTKNAGDFTVTPSGENIGLNQTFEIRRTDELGKEFPSEIKFDIRQGGQTLQSLRMHTSCSQPLELGDQFGSVILKQFVPKGSTSPSANVVYTYRVTNTGPAEVTVDVDDSQFGLIADDLSIPAGGTVELTETALLSDPGTVKNVVTVTDIKDPECSATDEVTVEVVLPPASCEDGKPEKLIMEYLGGTCPSDLSAGNTQDSGKVKCEDKAPIAVDPVYILAGDKDNPFDSGAGKFFQGFVSVGELFTIDATLAGNDKLRGDTRVHILDTPGGTPLQFIKFHTSCSQPLNVGDVFGTLELEGYIPEAP